LAEFFYYAVLLSIFFHKNILTYT